MEWKDKISTFKQIDVRGIQGNFFQGLKSRLCSFLPEADWRLYKALIPSLCTR